MKKLIVSLYIFFCTGGTYAQERQNTVVAEIDFNRSTSLQFVQPKVDTVRAELLLSRGHMTMVLQRMGYVVFQAKDTIYLDDRKRLLKPPITVWSFKIKSFKQ